MSLPKLIDCKGLQEEMGIKRHIAEALMRDCPTQRIPGSTKVFARRDDIQAVLDAGYLTDRKKAITYYTEQRHRVEAA